MKRLRIAQVAPYFHPHVGGVESHVDSISRELSRRGHDVTVVTSRLAGCVPEEWRGGHRVVRAPEWANVWSTPITPGLPRALASVAPEIVHAHSPPPLSAWYAARWARGERAPLVLTHHCDLEIPMPGGELVVSAYRRTLGRSSVRAAAAVIATTRTYAETSRSLWHRGDVHVIPNMVDPDRFRPDGDADFVRERHKLGDAPVALFVGRLAHHKGIEEFIRAAASTGPDVKHLIVGDGPRRAALERLAREVAPERVVFVGRVEGAELPAYYRAATVGVLPSTSRLEAFGIAALECMASGRPVVVSDMPGVGEVIERGVTGLTAEPVDPADLGAKIAAIARDPELAASMGKAARARVLERFTVGKVVDRLESVYDTVLSNR